MSIKQDFYAKVLTTNLTSMAANAAQLHVDKATAHRKHDYQVNFAQALSKMKNTIAELLALSGQELVHRLEKLFHYMARTTEPYEKEEAIADQILNRKIGFFIEITREQINSMT